MDSLELPVLTRDGTAWANLPANPHQRELARYGLLVSEAARVKVKPTSPVAYLSATLARAVATMTPDTLAEMTTTCERLSRKGRLDGEYPLADILDLIYHQGQFNEDRQRVRDCSGRVDARVRSLADIIIGHPITSDCDCLGCLSAADGDWDNALRLLKAADPITARALRDLYNIATVGAMPALRPIDHIRAARSANDF